MTEELNKTEKKWFYEENGQRKGPASEKEMIELIKSSTISNKTPIWMQGFQDWVKLENTELKIHIDSTSPPPLSGENVNNTIVWVLAFAPIIGYLLEWFIAGAIHGDNEYAIETAMNNSKYWFITLILNIVLALIDEKRLTNAGYNTTKFKGWVWIVPVYLYQRASATKQNISYFVVWIACFILVLFS